MGMFKVDIGSLLRKSRTAEVFDHFESYTDTQLWTKGGVNGTVTNPDANGGQIVLTTLASQSNTAFVGTTRKNWQFVANQPMVFQIGLNYTEAAVNQAGIFVGFTSVFTGILTNVTGVPLTPFSGCGIFKKPGDTLWSAITSVGATQQITQSKSSCIQPGLTQVLIVQVMVNAGGQVEATFWAGPPGPARQRAARQRRAAPSPCSTTSAACRACSRSSTTSPTPAPPRCTWALSCSRGRRRARS